MSADTPMRARGLPECLPAGETLLWQGAPRWRTLVVRAFHIRALAAYFGLILALCAVNAAGHGAPAAAIAHSLLHRAGLAAVPLLLIVAYAWAIQRSTTYTITSRRVVISFGMALPMSFNVPFATIAGAGMREYPGQTGDIPLSLLAGEKMSYLVLWPHVRPWRMNHCEPMLRCVPDVAKVSAILADALTAQAVSQPAANLASKRVRMPAGMGFGGSAVAAE